MAERDSFIDEVSEELRRDRMLRLWRRWGPWVAGAVILAVAAAGWMEWREGRQETRAREAGAALAAAAEAGDPAARAEAYAEVAERFGEGAARIARLSRAGALAEAGETAAAVEALRAVEDDGAAEPIYRQLAGFRAAMLEAPDLDPAARAEAMTPFVAEGAPFRLMALERRAAARLAAGDAAGAREDVETALASQALSPRLRQRLTEMRKLVGGADG